MSLKTLNALVELMIDWERQIRQARQDLAELARHAAMREATM